MTIYFIGDGEHIKIGYTGGEARKRLAQLQTGNSRALQLLATMDGGPDVEAGLHQQFAPYRLTGEWFAIQQDALRSLTGVEFVRGGATTAVATRPLTAATNTTKTAPEWVSLRSQVARLEKEADAVNGYECRAIATDWFRELYNRVQKPSGLDMVLKGRTMKSISVICALSGTFNIDEDAMQYESAISHYKKYKKYFSSAFFNSESWDMHCKNIAQRHGSVFVEQDSDAFWDYVSKAIAEADREGDCQYLRLGDRDQRKYFNALVLGQGMYRLKHRVEEQTGQYLSEQEAALGFYDWAKDYCMGAEYNPTEDEYRIRV